MKKLFIGIAAVFLILIVAVCALPFLVPASTYGQVAESRLEAMLGRDVTLASDPKITIFPQLGARIDDVEIANAEGFDDPYLAKAGSLSVAVKWLPLFSRRVEIAALRFEDAEVLLHQKSATLNNWTFSPAKETPEPVDGSGAPAGDPGFDAIVPRAELTNARIVFRDEVAGEVYEAEEINLIARLEGLEAPVGLDLNLVLNNEPLSLTIEASSLLGLTRDEDVETQVDFSSDMAVASFDGTFRAADTPIISGNFSSGIRDLPGLMAFLNIESEQDMSAIGQIDASGSVSGAVDTLSLLNLDVKQQSSTLRSDFTGDIRMEGSSPAISGTLRSSSSNLRQLLEQLNVDMSAYGSSAFKRFDADIALTQSGSRTNATINSLEFDDVEVTGTLGFDLSRDVPSINADLSIPKLDLSPYLVTSSGKPQASTPTDSWSEEPIDLSPLRLVNGEVKLAIADLTDGRGSVQDLRVSGTLSNGRFNGTLNTSAPDGGRSGTPSMIAPLYNGNLTTNIAVADVPNGPNTLRIDANGSGIAAAELIRFFTGMNVLRGVGALDSDVRMSGKSLADFVRGMNGTYSADVAEGAILGINLPQLLRAAADWRTALTSGNLPSALSPSQETDFSSLTLNGNISNGVANIDTFQMNAPFVRASATGSIDLFNRTLDIRITPRAVNTSSAQGNDGLKGFGIPLKISGSWTSVSGSLDMDFISDLARREAGNLIQNELSDRLGEDASGILGSVLGGSRTPTPSQTTTPAPADEIGETEETAEEETTPEDAARSLLRDFITNRNRED